MVAAGAEVYVHSKLPQEKGQVCLPLVIPALSDRYICITGQNNYVRRFHCLGIKLEKN